MKIIETTQVSPSATPSQLWNLWADIDKRATWDDDIDTIAANGPFGLGQTGTVVLKGQPARKFKVIEATKDVSYTDRFFLPAGAKMDWHHMLVQRPEGVAVTWLVEVTGPTAFILRPIMKHILKKALPGTVSKFISVAEATA